MTIQVKVHFLVHRVFNFDLPLEGRGGHLWRFQWALLGSDGLSPAACLGLGVAGHFDFEGLGGYLRSNSIDPCIPLLTRLRRRKHH